MAGADTRNKKLIAATIGVVFGIVLMLGCAAPSPTPPAPTPTAVATATPTPGKVGARQPSKDEQLVLDTLGPPQLFTLNMAPDDSDVLPRADEYDVWYYPDRGVSYTFINGSFVGSDDIGPMPAGARLPSVMPHQFRPGMTLAEVASVIGEQPGATFEIPGSIVPGSVLYVFKGVYAGFEGRRLVFVETFGYRTIQVAKLPELRDETTYAHQPDLSAGAAERSIKLASYDPGLSSPLAKAIPAFQMAPGWLKTAWKWISGLWGAKETAEATGRDVDYSTVEEMADMAAEAMREEAARIRNEGQQYATSDPTKKALYDQAAAVAEQMAKDWVDKVLPAIKSAKRWEQLKDVIGVIMPPGIGPEGKPKELQKLLDQFLKDKKLRPGEVRQGVKDWLDDLVSDWKKLDKDTRESLILDILKEKVKEQCGRMPGRRTEGWPAFEECFWTTVQNLKKQVRDWTGADECHKKLEELKQHMEKSESRRPNLGLLAALLEGIGGEVSTVFAASLQRCPVRGGDLVSVAGTATPTATPSTPTPTRTPINTPTPTRTVRPMPTPTPALPQLINPGFEKGLEGWEEGAGQFQYGGQSVLDETEARSGNRSRKLFLRWGGSDHFQRVLAELPAGTRIAVTAWVKMPYPGERSNKWFTLDLILGSADGRRQSAFVDRMPALPNWTQLTVGPLTADFPVAWIEVHARTTKGSGEYRMFDRPVWVDDFQLIVQLP